MISTSFFHILRVDVGSSKENAPPTLLFLVFQMSQLGNPLVLSDLN